jgi:uncharacterized protein (DUF2252 family)
MTEPTRMTVAERKERGKHARAKISRSGHADWTPRPDRRNPVSILAAQNEQRVQELVPIRHARMSVSPFTFYRGAAGIMAEDLSGTTDSGLWVQAGGDAHLSNFGAYASPSRELVFDQNDFDETLPGPWEWDLKRLVTSMVVAGQHLGFSVDEQRSIAAHTVWAYRDAMAHYADLSVMDLWYDYLSIDRLAKRLNRKDLAAKLANFESRARSKTNLQALKKLTTRESGQLRIRNQPPLLVPMSEVPVKYQPEQVMEAITVGFNEYVETTPDHMHLLLSRFKIVDMALKVVGVGSVGTRCWVVLLEGRDDSDPLFLQMKESVPSVLEDHLQPSQYTHQGQRVVEGQRLLQAQSDIFLGWTTGPGGRHFYVRQLRDWKGSANVEEGNAIEAMFYGGLCARTLARGHARSGDPVAISAYVGNSSKLDDSIAEFAMRYAKQNLEDYAAFEQAIADGVLPIAEGQF